PHRRLAGDDVPAGREGAGCAMTVGATLEAQPCRRPSEGWGPVSITNPGLWPGYFFILGSGLRRNDGALILDRRCVDFVTPAQAGVQCGYESRPPAGMPLHTGCQPSLA